MDARVFSFLSDSIAVASDTADLETARHLVRASPMDAVARRALEYAAARREAALRAGDVAVPRPVRAPRSD
jgi:hypothetical protein